MSILQKSIVLLIAAAIFGPAWYFGWIVVRHEHGWNAGKFAAPTRWIHPNVIRLNQAKKLVASGELPRARDIIVKGLLEEPISPVTRPMRDLLGEINTQLFFSKEPTPRKTEYSVRRGDSLSRIARQLRSTTDAIMRTNDLQTTRIHPGDKLLVPKLDFTITIDLPRERIVVHDSHGFFTQYRIVEADLPHTRSSPQQTKVRAKSFWKDGERVRKTPAKMADGTAWIHLQRPGYVLYGVDEESAEPGDSIDVTEKDEAETATKDDLPTQPATGIAMLKEDINDLQLLIRRGTPVTIIREESQRK